MTTKKPVEDQSQPRTRKKSAAKTGAARKTPGKARSTKKSSPQSASAKSASKRKLTKKRASEGRIKESALALSTPAQATRTIVATPTKTRAVIVQERGTDKLTLLERALEQAGFWQSLDEARLSARLTPEDFRILIKPDLSLFDQGTATGTDPELVEHLIDLLHQKGYSHTAVCEGRNSFDLWLENREVMVLAEMIGYKYITREGNSYDVVDLSEEVVDVAYPKGSALYGTGLARPWVEAHYRITFAKNKTDEEYFYALGLHSLLGVLPLRDKDYHYRHRQNPSDVCVDLLKQTPIHFSLIDAYVSNHGSAGSRVARSLETQTIIASPDLLLADWAATVKMGVDPYASPLNAKALREIGLPVAYEINGDLTTYEGWINVHPLIADSVRKRNEWVGLSRTIKPWLQPVNQELFPFKDAVNERLNRVVSRFFTQLDDNPAAFWANIGLNYWLGAVNQGLETFRTLYRKDSLRWKEAPLNIELSDYQLSDYEAIVAYLEPLEELIRHVAVDAQGLRWRYLDGSVLFEFSRVIPAPYEKFVARVDISRAIEFMNDYIGGVAVPVERDDGGRVTHQAERNLYLTQPNYLVLYEGKTIDVTKLEYIRYTEGKQKIFWKTIKSENESAKFDDGTVTFAKTANDETLVTVFGRQQFTLPLFWQAVNLDLNPLVKDFLVTHAYTTFFTQTFANFEARFEGREIRIGRPWNPLENEPDTQADGKTPTERLEAIASKVNKAGEVIKKHWSLVRENVTLKSKPKTAVTSRVDNEGFTHFQAETPQASESEIQSTQGERPDVRGALKKAGKGTRGFFSDLGKALQKDWGLYREDD